MLYQKIDKDNELVLEKLSYYLNFGVDFINSKLIEQLTNECGLKEEESFAILLAEICGFDIDNNRDDMEIYRRYFPSMIHILNKENYQKNAYYENIKIPEIEVGRWKLKKEKYKPYEGFVFNDMSRDEEGRIFPQLGFFDSEFTYPAVLEDNREWMLITPNEIETMKLPIEKAYGKVLTYGLGMGYYAYMVSEKSNVSSVTIVERDKDVINLFNKYILPQFKYKDKIRIIHDDAFSYAENNMTDEGYDFVFTDLWHDPSDGIDLYLKMKEYEKFSPKSSYMYWIEKTMLCYLE